jgi:5-methyltetrahydropteroyltriglutamate--homocysteine methyltransferase
MKTSETRILTTHSGSLPRPVAVKKLLQKKAAGEHVDDAELEAAVYAATEASVEKQIAAGIDVGNDGEQGRESFFTYVRERMSGFGGQSSPRVFADMVKYEGFMQKLVKSHFDENSVSLLAPPRAEGPVSYIAPQHIKFEVDRLKKIFESEFMHSWNEPKLYTGVD